ncbi:homoserine kinase [Xylanibacillus composti]|uniref:Homoserine kinase n=1 Tax=Xylanibacillus composti TaxID=1572762 RepID=A0A8J4H7U4_9BACL|nr:homoserine kinase [Xylanibacillus composti]GIQ70158.1 homoserine kinase [Xylanibacillus composti]
MSNEQRVYVRVPASTANLGPGFDTLGMALNLYAWVEMSWAAAPEVELYGDHLEGVPANESNLMYEVAQNLLAAAGEPSRPLRIGIYSEIPLTRGLGSSAAAIVGALVAANELAGRPFCDDELFQMATRLEKHPDNVGAALFGGIVVASWDGERAEAIRIEPDPRLKGLAVIPKFHLSTAKARSVLPAAVEMKEAVSNISRSSLLVAALSTGRLDVLSHAMKDSLHQPYRMQLIPGMPEILEQAPAYGALGAALSGAGPTLLALVDRTAEAHDRLERFMLETFRANGIEAEAIWLEPCTEGAQVLTHYDGKCTLIENIKGEVST